MEPYGTIAPDRFDGTRRTLTGDAGMNYMEIDICPTATTAQ